MKKKKLSLFRTGWISKKVCCLENCIDLTAWDTSPLLNLALPWPSGRNARPVYIIKFIRIKLQHKQQITSKLHSKSQIPDYFSMLLFYVPPSLFPLFSSCLVNVGLLDSWPQNKLLLLLTKSLPLKLLTSPPTFFHLEVWAHQYTFLSISHIAH